MVVFRFGRQDLLRTRFAVAPLMELVGAVDAMRDPTRFAVHRPWPQWARTQTRELDLSLLEIAVPYKPPFFPVFVGPPPQAPHASVREELERVAATPPQRVAAEIARAYPGGVPGPGRVLVDEPARGLELLVGQMRAFWNAALHPCWDRIAALLESEIAWRARRLAQMGARAAFTGLHETVHWDDGILRIHPTKKAPADIDLAGRGLLLVPAAFTWPLVWPRSDPPWEPALVYPPPGVADLWSTREQSTEPLEELIGRRRARVLIELDVPTSTLQLAQRLGVSSGGVSEHLGVLQRAGLVTRRREGRRVVYSRTIKGDGLADSKPSRLWH